MGHRRYIRALKDQPVGKRWRRYCGGGHTVGQSAFSSSWNRQWRGGRRFDRAFGVKFAQQLHPLVSARDRCVQEQCRCGRHGNYVFDVNLNREVIKNVTAYVELWSDYNADPTQKATLMSFDTAVAWVPNVQLDVGANFGLTSATPAVQVYSGLSQRF
jgi:hypothetical protein